MIPYNMDDPLQHEITTLRGMLFPNREQSRDDVISIGSIGRPRDWLRNAR